MERFECSKVSQLASSREMLLAASGSRSSVAFLKCSVSSFSLLDICRSFTCSVICNVISIQFSIKIKQCVCLQLALNNNYNNYNNTVYRPFLLDNPGEPASELSETLTQYTTLTVLKLLISIHHLPSQTSQSTSRKSKPSYAR